MANAAGDGSRLIPEQIWDRPGTVANGIALRTGEHTGSATPLAWATAQYVRLALSIDGATPVETPGVVAARYRQSVTLTVTVPDGTDSTGLVPYVAGELASLNGGYPNWATGLAAPGSNLPDGERLTRVDARTWRITLAALPDTTVAYKIVLNPATRGSAAPGWSTVEKSAVGGDIPDRHLVTATGNSDVAIAVARWAAVPVPMPCASERAAG
jgi:hypothetical protein